MSQSDAPLGALAALGHAANNMLAVKTGVGWRYLLNDEPVDDEAFGAGWSLLTHPVPCHERGARHMIGDERDGVMVCKVCGTVGARLA